MSPYESLNLIFNHFSEVKFTYLLVFMNEKKKVLTKAFKANFIKNNLGTQGLEKYSNFFVCVKFPFWTFFSISLRLSYLIVSQLS